MTIKDILKRFHEMEELRYQSKASDEWDSTHGAEYRQLLQGSIGTLIQLKDVIEARNSTIAELRQSAYEESWKTSPGQGSL